MTDSTHSHSMLETLQARAAAEGRECVVGGLIFNYLGRVFVQKRAADRSLFPGCWDITGGHVDSGETLVEALAREVEEETGWVLVRINELVEIFDWDDARDGIVTKKREFEFLIEVSGNLGHPRIEQDKFSEFRWIGEDDLGVLKENRSAEDLAIFNLVGKALQLTQAINRRN